MKVQRCLRYDFALVGIFSGLNYDSLVYRHVPKPEGQLVIKLRTRTNYCFSNEVPFFRDGYALRILTLIFRQVLCDCFVIQRILFPFVVCVLFGLNSNSIKYCRSVENTLFGVSLKIRWCCNKTETYPSCQNEYPNTKTQIEY